MTTHGDRIYFKNPTIFFEKNREDFQVDLSIYKLKYIKHVDRHPGCITYKEYIYLIEFIFANNIKSVLEFGPGLSTCAFSENNCETHSCEDKNEWVDFSRKSFCDFSNISVYKYNNKKNFDVEGLKKTFFDMAFVDAPLGSSSFSRLHTCTFASKKTNCFILHDCFRKGEQETIKLFVNQGWKYVGIKSDKGLGILYKNNYIIPDYNDKKINLILNKNSFDKTK